MIVLSARARARLRRERERLEEEAEETTELNLVPYLDIVTNILMFLLATITSMVALGNINVSVPARAQVAASSGTPEPPKQGLNLTVAISGTGFILAGSGGVMYQNDAQGNPIPGKLPTLPKTAGDKYDLDGLRKLILKIKKAYPEEKQVILSANPDVQYDTVIAVMDVLRQDGSQELFPLVLFSAGVR
jgi:biopolymer transport protein ExbD